MYQLLPSQQGETAMYLKHGRRGEAAQALADKAARLRWLGDALPCQRLLHFEGSAGQACVLLSSEVPGSSAYDWLEVQPERAVAIAQAARAAHQYLSV